MKITRLIIFSMFYFASASLFASDPSAHRDPLKRIAAEIEARTDAAKPTALAPKVRVDVRDPDADATTRKPMGIVVNIRLKGAKKLQLGATGGIAAVGKMLRDS